MIKKWALAGVLLAGVAVAPGLASAASSSDLSVQCPVSANMDLTSTMVDTTESGYDLVDATSGQWIDHWYEYVDLCGIGLAVDPIYFFTG